MAGRPAPAPGAAADALLGNIFLHTREGTEFAVTLHAGDGVVAIFFADSGPGTADPDAALQRGRDREVTCDGHSHTVSQTGVKQFNLAFVVSGGGCTVPTSSASISPRGVIDV